MNIFNMTKSWFLNLEIRYKLMLSFTLMIIIPAIIMSSLYYINTRKILIDKTNKYTNDILAEIQKSIQINLNDMDSAYFNLLENNEVQSALIELKNNPNMSMARNFELGDSISKILYKLSSNNQIIKVVYIKSYYSDNFTAYAGNGHFNYLDEKNVNCVEEGSGKTVWLKTEKDYFAYARGINSVTDFNPLGYIVIYYYENDLCKIYSDISLSMNAQMFIIDNDGNVISNSQKDTLGKKLPNAYLLALRNNRNIFLGKGAFNNGNCYIVSRSINNGQWILVYQISEKEFNKEVVAVLNEVILITSACIVIITLFSFLLSSVLSKPIINLTKQMKLAQSGDYSGYIDYKYTDEVGELSHNFNEMLKSTNHLIRVVYEKELIKQRVELEYLKLQINPHFLYNTLEVINWTARSNGLEDVGVIAKALGDLMRKALDPNDFVTFREEVDVVNNYLVIQKFRYGDKINYSADIDTKIMDAKVPIFILQPIIENSIIHGIEPKLTQGNIKLTGVIDNNDILLTIEDDGVGIPESVLNSIMTDTESQVQSSMQCKIGLRNVKKRLQFIYGENCALTIESELGKMTKVIVRLPFETKHADT